MAAVQNFPFVVDDTYTIEIDMGKLESYSELKADKKSIYVGKLVSLPYITAGSYGGKKHDFKVNSLIDLSELPDFTLPGDRFRTKTVVCIELLDNDDNKLKRFYVSKIPPDGQVISIKHGTSGGRKKGKSKKSRKSRKSKKLRK